MLRTTLVGSYPQPDWLIDRDRLGTQLPPRVRADALWRVAEPWLEQAQDDATLLALRDMERAGLDVVTDGEQRRESYSNRFATALAGIDLERPAEIRGRTGRMTLVPRVVGPIRRQRPVQVRDVQFLRAATDRAVMATLPGPFTMAQQAVDEYYDDEAALTLAYAEAVNDEARDLVEAGADIVQLDEPWLQTRVEAARAFALPAIARALDSLEVDTVLHTCFGYGHVVRDKPSGYGFFAELNDCAARQISIEAAQPRLDLAVLRDLPDKRIVLGVLDLSDDAPVEKPEEVAARIRSALAYVEPERLVLAPDCGMKYLSRETAFAKLQSLVGGARLVRAELA